MEENNILNKKIIYLTKNGATYNSDTKNDFYIDILEPIKNASHIKILKSTLRLKPTYLNGLNVIDGDPIYIYLNDYKRINTIITADNGEKSVLNSFEIMNLNLTSKYTTMASGAIAELINANGLFFENEYSTTTVDFNDTTVYNLVPDDPSLLRFYIKIYDKFHNLIDKDDIMGFDMYICVYSSNKKITMN